jgi:[histone H3]-lysine36 N-dimethyltransferase SETMAR
MLQNAYGKSTLSKTTAYKWYKAFKSGRGVMEDLAPSGRPSTSATKVNIAKMKEIVTDNPYSTLRQMAIFLTKLSVSFVSIRTILTINLGIKHIAASLVPNDLNFLQKLNRMSVAEDMPELVNSDPTFMKRIVTDDETWVYKFDMQTSQHAAEWRVPTEPKPKKPRQWF